MDEKMSREERRRESTERYRHKVRRFTFQFSLKDDEAREWFEAQEDKGLYLKQLILADKQWEKVPSPQPESHPEKRMAGDYEIVQSLYIGDKEIVMGENLADTNGQMYMCAYCTPILGMFERFDEAVASDDYAEIVKIYGDRVAKQAEKTRVELLGNRSDQNDYSVITAENCTPITHEDDLNGKIVVIKSSILRREYRAANHQLKLCTGGFGASPNSRGSACFCTDLFSGKQSRFERWDILGTMEPGDLPQWAKDGLAAIQQAEKSKSTKTKEAR